MLGFVIVLGLVLTAAVAPLVIAEEDANEMNIGDRFEGPSLEHPFGTDQFGRDIFTRILLGARISITIAVFSVAIAGGIGVPLGAIAGYTSGRLDDTIMRMMDVLLGFPPLIAALAIAAILGPSLKNVIIAIGVVYIPYFARVTRSEVVSVSEEEFVEASRALGESDSYILFFEVLPNSAAPVIVQASISMGYALLSAAAISFLGLGPQPPQPDWGLMINQSKGFLSQAPWMAIFPGLAIAITVLGFNFLGDGIRDVLDPKLKTEMEGGD